MGLCVITVLCVMSFIQLTFVVEALANANFDKKMSTIMKENDVKTSQSVKDDVSSNPLWFVKHSLKNENKTTLNGRGNESTTVKDKQNNGNSESAVPSTTNVTFTNSDTSKVIDLTGFNLCEYFEINDKFELGDISEAFLEHWMSFLFFVSILAYLYGDLIIYNTMMTKSVREVACTYEYTCDKTIQLYEKCWQTIKWTRHDVYRIMLMALMIVLIPLTYFGLTKTKIIQVITIILRWAASLCMIGIAIHVIIVTKDSTAPTPKLASIVGFPRMFGICVYGRKTRLLF